MKIEKGNRVKVEFTSESATQFSGDEIKGFGVVDRCEDGYVFGRLECGKPFMCSENDCELVIDSSLNFEHWFLNQDFYTNMRFIHGDNLFSKDGDVYRVLPVQMAYVVFSEKHAEYAEAKQVGIALNTETINQRRYIGSQQSKIEQLEQRIDDALGFLVDGYVEHAEQALRGEHE